MTAMTAPTMTAAKAGGRDTSPAPGVSTASTARAAGMKAAATGGVDVRLSVQALRVAGYVLVGLSYATAFVMGWTGLVEVAGWAGLGESLRWIVPVNVDGGILVFTVTAVIHRMDRTSARFSFGVLGALIALSMLAQVLHVTVAAEAVPQSIITAFGAAVAATAPLIAYAAIHELTKIAVRAPKEVRRRTSHPAPRPAPKSAPRSAADPKPPVSVPAPEVKPRKESAAASSDRDELRAEVIRLRGAGMSYGAISEATGVPVSTAKRWAAATSLSG